jgi:dimethylhistidine N-methyltransferase
MDHEGRPELRTFRLPAGSLPAVHGSPSGWGRRVREEDEIRAEVARGLSQDPPRLPSRFFYDREGARLFEAITRLEEYYLTDTEIGILRRSMGEVAKLVGAGARIVEYGSGSGEKTWILLEGLDDPAAYVPVDVSREQLRELARQVAARFPGLEVLPVAADYTALNGLPWPTGRASGSTLAFFPGSTVGNLEPAEARDFLRQVGRQTGSGSFLLIGVDLVKDRVVLERAYNDGAGVTARFNRNMLTHLNRLLGADFEPEAFRHRAVWNPSASRIEMHLVSTERQAVSLGPEGPRFTLDEGDHLVTEHSYKYDPADFRRLAAEAGYTGVEAWSDPKEWFSVQLLQVT